LIKNEPKINQAKSKKLREFKTLYETANRQLFANLSLTPNETEVYLFVSKRGPSKCNEIAKTLSKNRPHTYRILTKLEHMNMIEKTLESPTRFVAVPLKNFLDLKIHEKQEQTLMLKQTRKEVLLHWKEIQETSEVVLPEKIALIEGQNRISGKTKQIIGGVKRQLIFYLGIVNLSPILQHEIENLILKKAKRKSLSFRILESPENLSHQVENQKSNRKDLLKNIQKRTLSRELNLATNFVVRDDEETLILPSTIGSTRRVRPKEICIWTDSKPIIAILKTLFERLWQDSTDFVFDDMLHRRKYSQKTIKEVSKWYINDPPENLDMNLIA